MSKTIFITGASTGLGRATAQLFQSRGWRVAATMRNPDNGEELQELDGVEVIRLDVTDPEQIKAAVASAIDRFGTVDVVLNNAGYGLAGPLEALSDEQIERQLNTNLLGVLRTTREFLPHLRENGGGTLITTTSIGGLIALPFFSAYHATKWALEGWSESLRFELMQFGIAVKTVSPGGIKTDFASRSLDFNPHPAYAESIQRVMATFGDPNRGVESSTAEQIAEVIFGAATDGSNQLRYVAGADAKAMHQRRLEVGDHAFMEGVREDFLGG